MPGVLIDPVSGGVAERAGVKSGDILLSIDEIAMMRPDSVLKTLGTGHTSYILKVQRSDTVHTIAVTPIGGKI